MLPALAGGWAGARVAGALRSGATRIAAAERAWERKIPPRLSGEGGGQGRSRTADLPLLSSTAAAGANGCTVGG